MKFNDMTRPINLIKLKKLYLKVLKFLRIRLIKFVDLLIEFLETRDLNIVK